MKKKILLIISLVSVSWFVYRALSVPPEKVVEINNDTKVISLETIAPPSLKANATAPYKAKESEDEQFLAFDKFEKTWLLKAQEIIGSDKYAQYLEMRNQNEKEKLQAYNEYHEYLRQKYGDKFSYNITDDHSAKEKQINQRYLKDLLTLIGPEKFKTYTAAKDLFNEEMRRQNKESIHIEF